MATTYASSEAKAGIQPKSLHAGAIVRSATFALTAALAADDVIQMFKLPKGAVVHDVVLAASDLDTDVSPAIALDVGDADTPARFISASTLAQAGGVARADQAGGVGHSYDADTMIEVSVETGPATGATSGTVTLTVVYSMDA